MLLVTVCLGLALLAGYSVFAVVRRWPQLDPASPRPAAAAAETLRRGTRMRSFLRRRVDPGAATGLALSVAAVLIVVGAIGLGVLTAMVRANTGFVRYDTSVARWAGEHATHVSTNVLRALTYMGSTIVIVPLSIAVTALELKRLPSRALVAFVVLVVAGQLVLANLVKWAVDRTRPDIDPLAGFSGPSFPSGHTTAAAATYAALALMVGRQRPLRTKALLAGAAVAIAVAVGATRVLLGVHWLTDVIAGFALGWGWFAVSSIAFGGRLLRFGAPVEAAERAGPERSVVPS